MSMEDEKPNPFEAPALEQASSPEDSPGESPAEENDLLLLWAASELSQARFWIWCTRTVLLMLAVPPLVIALYLIGEAGPLGFVAAECAVVLVYVAGGLIAWRFSAQVGNFLTEPNCEKLEEVFQAETGYWKYWGLLSLVSVVIFGCVLLTMITSS